MTRTTDNPALNRFAMLTAMATLGLIGVGGLVTSHGAGMAVPDWPTTYGYNPFLFPISKWMGGIFYEHTHRLVASGVGFLTIILAVWLWMKEARAWLRWLGVAAFVAVIVQGVLGGLRVTLIRDEIGIFHATLAQLFLVLVILIALFTSRWWLKVAERSASDSGVGTFRFLLFASTILIFFQLVLGATMRHQHAGLAVPDFPLAYGRVWPRMDAAFLEKVNQTRLDVRDYRPITAVQIGLHMAHRIAALLILIAVGYCAMRSHRSLGRENSVSRLAKVWLILVLSQAVLGSLTVLKNKPADIATAHVVLGALSLAAGSVVIALAFCDPEIARQRKGREPRLSLVATTQPRSITAA